MNDEEMSFNLKEKTGRLKVNSLGIIIMAIAVVAATGMAWSMHFTTTTQEHGLLRDTLTDIARQTAEAKAIDNDRKAIEQQSLEELRLLNKELVSLRYLVMSTFKITHDYDKR